MPVQSLRFRASRTESSKIGRNQCWSVLKLSPPFRNGFGMTVRPVIPAGVAGQTERDVLRNSVGTTEHAARPLSRKRASSPRHDDVPVVSHWMRRTGFGSEALFVEPVEQIARQFNDVVPLVPGPCNEQQFPGCLRVHNYAAIARASRRPIFVSSSVRSPTVLTFCDNRVSALTSEKMVNPPCSRAMSIASLIR